MLLPRVPRIRVRIGCVQLNALSQFRQGRGLVANDLRERGQPHVESESAAVGAKLERLRAEMRVENLHEKLTENFDVNGGDAKTLHMPGDGVQAKINLCDDPKSTERSGHQFVEVIAGHVLDDFAAGASDRAVREHDGHANDAIAKAYIYEA